MTNMHLISRRDYGRVKTIHYLSTDDLVRAYIEQDTDESIDLQGNLARHAERRTELLVRLIEKLPPKEQLELLGDEYELAQ